MAAADDIELMQHHDGELPERASADVEARLANDPEARAKQESLAQVDEVVRGHLELAADNVSDRRFDAMWKEIDAATSARKSPGVWARITGWFDRYRGHVITGALSAGVVAALALILRTGGSGHDDGGLPAQRPFAIDVQPASMRTAPEIESLDTPNGEGTVLNLEDEDGHTTVIWVSPEDTVEGI